MGGSLEANPHSSLGMPTILLNIITDTIAPHPDLDIVGKRGRSGRLLDAAEQTHADVIIVTRQGSGAETTTRFFIGTPD